MALGFGDFAATKKADITIKPNDNSKKGQPVMVSLGVHVEGACLPIPDPTSLVNVVGGLCKRNCTRNPKINVERLEKLRIFVAEWLGKHMTPLTGMDLDIMRYLSGTHYPLWRQRELLKVAMDRCFDLRGGGDNGLQPKDEECIQFIKRETYPSFKEARLINARPDAFKVFSGPFFHAIEHELFKLHWFVKYVPVRDRAKLIAETLYYPGCKVICTDYSSFESMFVPVLMEAVEMQLYRYMARDLPQFTVQKIMKVLTGTNIMKYRSREGRVTTRVAGTRMSGDMCTSLGNGFTNLMLMLFVAKECGVQAEGFVEGDDGIFTASGPIDVAIFAELGATIKLEMKEANEASFCGNVFDLTAMLNVADPIEKLVGFGWSTSRLAIGTGKNHKMLLHAKALSLLYEYPGCPILAAFAKWILRVTGDQDVKRVLNDASLDMWERERLEKAVKCHDDRPVSEGSRWLMAELYGVGIWEQKFLEAYFNNQTTLHAIPSNLIDTHVVECWRTFWMRCVDK